MQETPLIFDVQGDRLVGILHHAAEGASVGIVIVVGGPQYRVGSHRQFVIMARRFAAAGYPVLRFDYRGMGDSDGSPRTFEEVDEDIRAAIDTLVAVRSSVARVVLLGLCDAASASLMYCVRDSRVVGLVLLNPWVRTPAGEAKSYLRHYYVKRLMQLSLWRKVFSGKYDIRKSTRDFLRFLAAARATNNGITTQNVAASASFIMRMQAGFMNFERPILMLLSGLDLTAREFVDMCEGSQAWRQAVERTSVELISFPRADHTMSARSDLEDASEACLRWLRQRVNT